MTAEIAQEQSTINVTKPYKPRRLLQDTKHRMARLKYKRRPKNTAAEQKKKRLRKLWALKNRHALKRRAEFVHRQRESRGLT